MRQKHRADFVARFREEMRLLLNAELPPLRREVSQARDKADAAHLEAGKVRTDLARLQSAVESMTGHLRDAAGLQGKLTAAQGRVAELEAEVSALTVKNATLRAGLQDAVRPPLPPVTGTGSRTVTSPEPDGPAPSPSPPSPGNGTSSEIPAKARASRAKTGVKPSGPVPVQD